MFRKILIGFGILLLLTGCLRRVEVVRRERIDQSLSGNRGVIQGAVPTTPSAAPSTREYMEWDIEVPTYEIDMRVPEWHREWVDKELWGNRGYMMGGPARKPKKEESSSAQKEQGTISSFFRRPAPVTLVGPAMTKPAPSYTTYTVKKGDTLGDISIKVYGTSKKWRRIYEANSDVMKDPNHLKAGQTLRIPPVEEKVKPASSSGTIK